tara:strand:- start:168 stop:812 length:645 start_codon:yes stop_codon:yes gene_type:complete
MPEIIQIATQAAKAGAKVLNVGAGHNPLPDMDNLDRDPDIPGLAFAGDVRALWNPNEFGAHAGNLHQIPDGSYDYVVAMHMIEHVEWIYQISLLQLFCQWLNPRGTVLLETPNFAYAISHYTKRRLQDKFPLTDHPDIKTRDDPVALQRWINFKLFSGCSTGDYHHCAYDKTLLQYNMEEAGFGHIRIASKEILVAIGQPAPPDGEETVDYEFV